MHPSLQQGSGSWSFVSEQIHPSLQVPFLHLHPCGTADLLRNLVPANASPEQYLEIWLQAVLSLVLPDAMDALKQQVLTQTTETDSPM